MSLFQPEPADTYQGHRSGHPLTGNTSPKVSHSCSVQNTADCVELTLLRFQKALREKQTNTFCVKDTSSSSDKTDPEQSGVDLRVQVQWVNTDAASRASAMIHVFIAERVASLSVCQSEQRAWSLQTARKNTHRGAGLMNVIIIIISEQETHKQTWNHLKYWRI